MIKNVKARVWAFDLEWVPDPMAGRLVYGLGDDLTDLEVLQEMWRRGGATDDNPQPYLKVNLCRVVSVAVPVPCLVCPRKMARKNLRR